MSETQPTGTPTKPTAGIRIGSLTITGWRAVVAVATVMIGIVTIAVRVSPPMQSWPVWISALVWVSFIAYWSVAARTAAPSLSTELPASRQRHVRLMNLAFLLLFIPVPLLRGSFLPASLSTVVVGLALQFACFALAISARRHLGRNWSGAIATAVDHRLVRSGPYRVVRHPIYTAMIGMFAGAAIVWNAVHALLAAVVITYAYARKIPLEERNLRDVFGADYDAYRRETRAVIPWIW